MVELMVSLEGLLLVIGSAVLSKVKVDSPLGYLQKGRSLLIL
jgi:hypothetical protein